MTRILHFYSAGPHICGFLCEQLYNSIFSFMKQNQLSRIRVCDDVISFSFFIYCCLQSKVDLCSFVELDGAGWRWTWSIAKGVTLTLIISPFHFLFSKPKSWCWVESVYSFRASTEETACVLVSHHNKYRERLRFSITEYVVDG